MRRRVGSSTVEERTFRLFRPWYQCGQAALLTLAAVAASVAIIFGSPWCLVGVVAPALAMLALTLYYRAQAVIVRGGDLVVRTGMVWTREYITPIWDVRLELRQGIFGRCFDYATIQQRTDRGTVCVRAVAGANELGLLIAKGRTTIPRPVYLSGQQAMYPVTALDKELALAPVHNARPSRAVLNRIIH